MTIKLALNARPFIATAAPSYTQRAARESGWDCDLPFLSKFEVDQNCAYIALAV